SHFHLVMPIKAATLTITANQSTVFAAGKTMCRPNQTARFKTTPTTAAVTADNAVVSPSFPRSCSLGGPPRKIHKKQGTNVVQVVTKAPRVAARIGGSWPGLLQAPRKPTNYVTMI